MGALRYRFGGGLRVLAALVAVAFLATTAGAEELKLNEVPAYIWYHGCSPTSGMMLFGYWDIHGCSNLITGSNNWNTNQVQIQESIASAGHVADYALYNGENDAKYASPKLDVSTISPGSAHADDCLADFMGTSRSSLGQQYGSTRDEQHVAAGMRDYATHKGYDFQSTYIMAPSFSTFIRELQFGRPVLLNVDANAEIAGADHTVVAIGYRNINDVQEYACYDTWYPTVHPWEKFEPIAAKGGWGVQSMHLVRTTGTRDSAFTATTGNWHNTGSWDSGVPDASTFTYVPYGSLATIAAPAQARMVNNGGLLTVKDTLTAGDVRVMANGVIWLDSDSATLNVSNTILNDAGLISGRGTINGTLTLLSSGRVRAVGGTLRLLQTVSDSSLLEIAAGATLELNFPIDKPERIVNAGRLVFKMPIGQPMRLSEGTLGDSANTENAGAFEWSGGTIGGSGGVTNTSGTFTITGAGRVDLERWPAANPNKLVSATLNNSGTIRHNGGGQVAVTDGGVVSNAVGSVYDLQDNGGFSRYAWVTGHLGYGYPDYGAPIYAYSTTGRIDNAGTFRKSGGTGTSTVGVGVAFYNTGTVEVDSGTLAFSGGFTQTAGTTSLDGGTLSAIVLNILGGTVTGSGTITGSVSSGGIISPGHSPGQITLTGNYTQTAGGLLQIEIAGLVAGAEYDRLAVSGNATLAGELELDFINGFAPHTGDVFDFLTIGGTPSGGFSTVAIEGLAPGFEYNLSYTAGAYRLTALDDGVPTPEPGILALIGVLGCCALARRPRRRATA